MWKSIILSVLVPLSFGQTYFQTPTCNTWQGNKDYCEANGAILATFNSPAQVETIYNLCTDPFICWVGFIDNDGDEQLEFVDGELLDHTAAYALWYPGEPSFRSHICGCVARVGGVPYTTSLCDFTCDRCYPGICEITEDDEPEFVIGFEAKNCAQAQKYCKDVYGTQLATIITDDDRSDAMDVLNEAGAAYGWVGLYSDPVETQWRFRSGDECPSSSSYKCVDFWLTNPGGGAFRPRCIGPTEGGYECAVFYATENGVDNNVDTDDVIPFLCDKE